MIGRFSFSALPPGELEWRFLLGLHEFYATRSDFWRILRQSQSRAGFRGYHCDGAFPVEWCVKEGLHQRTTQCLNVKNVRRWTNGSIATQNVGDSFRACLVFLPVDEVIWINNISIRGQPSSFTRIISMACRPRRGPAMVARDVNILSRCDVRSD